MALPDEEPFCGKDTSVPGATVAVLSGGINAKKSARAMLPPELVAPVGPVAPVAPLGPVGPVAPPAPVVPAGPSASLVPADPVAPGGPPAPVDPVAPTCARTLQKVGLVS